MSDPLLVTLLVVLHMGALHPYEKVLTVVLAFGPFVVLGTVVAVRRGHEDDEDHDHDDVPGRPVDHPSTP